MAAVKSASMAFDPTPALESNKENFSPVTEKLKVNFQHSQLERRSSKEVHFSHVMAMSPTRRAQSLAPAVPFLEPISSASHLPRQNSRVKNLPLDVDMAAYMEQSRSVLESQRLNFDKEREIFEKERKLWNAERAMLRAKIADLEFNVKKSSAGRRRFSNDALSAGALSFRKGITQKSSSSSRKKALQGSSDANGAHPVWETPDMGLTVTRVFSNEEAQQLPNKSGSLTSGLAGIHESASKKPVCPRSVPVPVALLDSSLDGITLKSAALESSFVRISSPTSTSPRQSTSPGPRVNEEGNTWTEDRGLLLAGVQPNLVRNAGHTPMEFGIAGLGESASGVESQMSPEDRVLAPAQTHDPVPDLTDGGGSSLHPSESSDSYFSSVLRSDVTEEALHDGDVELKGPLTMRHKPQEGCDDPFLNQLDAKLLVESQRPQSDLAEEKNALVSIVDEVDDGVPRLKLKKSMNFGSAFGSKNCGKI